MMRCSKAPLKRSRWIKNCAASRQAAAYLFEGSELLRPAWEFKTRRPYFPPPDPANALLSLAYTLCQDVEAQKIQLVGLDPLPWAFFTRSVTADRRWRSTLNGEFRPSIADSVRPQPGPRRPNQHWPTSSGTNEPERPVRCATAMDRVVGAYETRLEDRIFFSPACRRGQDELSPLPSSCKVRWMARIVRQEADVNEPLGDALRRKTMPRLIILGRRWRPRANLCRIAPFRSKPVKRLLEAVGPERFSI